MKRLIQSYMLLVLLIRGCLQAPKSTWSVTATASSPDQLRQELAPKLQSILPQGWSLGLDGNTFALRRSERVLLYNPVGLPPSRTLDETVKEFGFDSEYVIRLRFEPLLRREEYEKLKREREPFEKILNNGANSKDEWGKAVGEYHKHLVPVYFTDRYSIFAEKSDAFPLQIYPESVAAECKQVIASLDSLFRRYERKTGKNRDFYDF